MYCWLLLHISPSDLWLVMYSRVTHVIVFYALICIFLKLYIHVNDVWFDTCCMKTLVRISCAVFGEMRQESAQRRVSWECCFLLAGAMETSGVSHTSASVSLLCVIPPRDTFLPLHTLLILSTLSSAGVDFLILHFTATCIHSSISLILHHLLCCCFFLSFYVVSLFLTVFLSCTLLDFSIRCIRVLWGFTACRALPCISEE